MTVPSWIRSRWVVLPALLGATAVLWNLYVAVHAGGRIEGRVVDAAGRPVAGASVLLFERGFVAHNEKARTRSDEAGIFRFSGNQNHSLQIEAEAPGLGRSERQLVRLWFRAQDTKLNEPLRLGGRLP
jgi:hypothetical protein